MLHKVHERRAHRERFCIMTFGRIATAEGTKTRSAHILGDCRGS